MLPPPPQLLHVADGNIEAETMLILRRTPLKLHEVYVIRVVGRYVPINIYNSYTLAKITGTIKIQLNPEGLRGKFKYVSIKWLIKCWFKNVGHSFCPIIVFNNCFCKHMVVSKT